MALLTLRVLEDNPKTVQNSSRETENSPSSSGKLFRPWAGFVNSKSELKNFENPILSSNSVRACERVVPENVSVPAHQDCTVSTTTPTSNLKQNVNSVCCEKTTDGNNFSNETNNQEQCPKSSVSKKSSVIEEPSKTGSHKNRQKVDIYEKKSKRLAEHQNVEKVKHLKHHVEQNLKISVDDVSYPAFSAYDISGIPQLCCPDILPCDIQLTHVNNRTHPQNIDMTMLSGVLPGIDTILPPELVSNFDFALSQGLLSPLTTVEEYARLFQDQQKSGNKKQRPKKYKCPHCQVAFSNNGQLKGHVRIHTGERPFKCDVESCGKTFTRNEELTRHKRIHSGVRPYPCSSCGKRFGRKDHLKKHSRTHQVHHRLIPLHMPFIHPYPYPYGY